MVRCNQHIGSMLQTTTRMDVIRESASVKWTYAATDSVMVGSGDAPSRSHWATMVDLIRHFVGRSWAPMRVELTAPRVDVRSIRELFGCDVVQGQSSAAVVFANNCPRGS